MFKSDSNSLERNSSDRIVLDRGEKKDYFSDLGPLERSENKDYLSDRRGADKRLADQRAIEPRASERHALEPHTSNDEVRLKFKIRFDYKGKPKPPRFFFGGKKTEDVAMNVREQQVTLWRNIPLQGLFVENIELGELYHLHDDELGEEVAFAPLELMVYADSLEDMLRFILREEFRRIEILEPRHLNISNKETEKLLFKINELLQSRIKKIKEANR